MKSIIYLLLLFPFICFGQVPQSMSYQAMATNSEGFEIANSQISVKVSIIEETPSGLVSFVEDHTVTTDAYGMFSINIGQGNTEDDYTAVDWSKSNFLKVELDDNMDGAYSLMGVSAFNSVPYSYMAENVMNPDELKDNLGDHTATQTLDMDSNFVSQVMAPELPLDAANKQYVDDMIGDITTGAGEIVHFNFTEGNYTTFNDYADNERILVCIVPENKIRVFKNNFLVTWVNENGQNGTEQPTPFLVKMGLYDTYGGIVHNGNETLVLGFPGDTICIGNFGLQWDEELISCDGFCYQYTVSATQIDDNTTSYSMVSLDEGASSSGGTITEGTDEESGSFKYMLAPMTPWEMQFKNAVEHCRDLSFDGYTDWRLPSIDELIDALSGGAENSNLSPVDPSDNQVWTRTFDPSMGSQYNGYLRLYLNNFAYVESDNWESDYYNSANTICIRGR